MASQYHAIVWIDHREARVFHFNATEVDRMILHPHNPTRHIHHKANAIGGGAPLDQEFFEQVTEAIADAKAILITGPSSAKSELAAHVARRHSDIAHRVVGVETIDHPSDGALIAVARLYFKAETLKPKTVRGRKFSEPVLAHSPERKEMSCLLEQSSSSYSS